MLDVTNGQDPAGGSPKLRGARGIDRPDARASPGAGPGTVSDGQRLQVPAHPSLEQRFSVDAATLGLPAESGTSLAQGRFPERGATARESSRG